MLAERGQVAHNNWGSSIFSLIDTVMKRKYAFERPRLLAKILIYF